MKKPRTRPDDTLPPGPQKATRAEAKAERRQQLINATIDCIAKFGLTGTTMGKVTEIAGVSMGLANFHFESKDRLLLATMKHLAEEERATWRTQLPALDAKGSRSHRDVLQSIIEARFHPTVCNRRKLAVWYAFYGDAEGRVVYRKIMGDMDDERLEAQMAIVTAMVAEAGYAGIDPYETVMGIEAFIDGLWLNMLVYPNEFRREMCRARAMQMIAALFPQHFGPAPARD